MLQSCSFNRFVAACLKAFHGLVSLLLFIGAKQVPGNVVVPPSSSPAAIGCSCWNFDRSVLSDFAKLTDLEAPCCHQCPEAEGVHHWLFCSFASLHRRTGPPLNMIAAVQCCATSICKLIVDSSHEIVSIRSTFTLQKSPRKKWRCSAPSSPGDCSMALFGFWQTCQFQLLPP